MEGSSHVEALNTDVSQMLTHEAMPWFFQLIGKDVHHSIEGVVRCSPPPFVTLIYD